VIAQANLIVALAAGLTTLTVASMLLWAMRKPVLRALGRSRPEIRAWSILALAGAPLVLGLLAAVGVGLYPHVSPFDVIAHHCHVSSQICSAHEAAPVSGVIASLTLLLSLLVVMRIGWSVANIVNDLRQMSQVLSRAGAQDGGIAIRLDSRRLLAFAQGIFSPRIIISEGLANKLTRSEYRLVTAHEAAHIRRGDLLARFAFSIMASLFPDNLKRDLADALLLAQEQACDALTARKFEPTVIASLLVKIERLKLPESPSLQAASIGDSVIKQRVHALLQPGFESGRTSIVRMTMITAGAAVLMLTGLEVLHHEIESFFMALGG
jgi:beta-lactamase regulating signal transducer with metallopeptidase domain